MKINLILTLLFLSASTFAQRNNQEPYLTKSLSGANIKEAFVNTSGGSIAVRGTIGNEVRVEVFVNDNHGEPLSKAEAAKRLENYNLNVDVHDGEVHASAKAKSNFRWGNSSLSISFRLYVPVRTATNLETSGGSISLDNLIGAQQFETSGGSLHVDHLSGNIKGQTSGGSISVANSRETINLETSGGSINADNCAGNIRLETSGGSLTLNNLSGVIKAETSGGSVNGGNINGELVTSTSGGSITLNNLSASLDASTSAGSLHATFKQVGKYVKLNADAGHIDLTLPYKQGLDIDLTGDHITSYNVPRFDGKQDRDVMRGKTNGGGSPVRADAGSGRINVYFAN